MAPTGQAALAALLQHGDAAFVQLAYLAVLGREVDDTGLAHYVEQLRDGVAKADVVVQLASSLEGRSRHASLAGLDALVQQSQSRAASRWTRLLRRVRRPFTLPSEALERGWRIVDNHLARIDAVLARQSSELAALHAELARLSLSAAPAVSSSDATRAAPGRPAAVAGVAAQAGVVAPPRAQALLQNLRRAQALRHSH